jgi:hypothetical protein
MEIIRTVDMCRRFGGFVANEPIDCLQSAETPKRRFLTWDRVV